MPIGPPYWIRMVYLKNGKWSAVCLIEYVWSNFFQLTAPAYVLMSMYRLFGTEEYLGFKHMINKCTIQFKQRLEGVFHGRSVEKLFVDHD